MKKTLIIAASMVALVTVFASAQPGSGYRSSGPMHGGQRGIGLDTEELETVSGRIRLQEDQLPSVTSGGTTYSLHIPRLLIEEISIQDGQQVSVEGYVTTARSFDLLREETILRVRAMEAEGTRVVVPSQGDRRAFSTGSSSQRAPSRGSRR